VRQVYERWFAGTAARDLDGMMAAVADEVVSYEHGTPMEHRGVDAVREVCRRNLEASGGASVTWDVPDLTVLVRDDLAVAWGLDHVRVDPAVDSWSRGTRVFARRDGEWRMIHQHLSVPCDPATAGPSSPDSQDPDTA
jgi:ketosteroid isomerase-like protein